MEKESEGNQLGQNIRKGFRISDENYFVTKTGKNLKENTFALKLNCHSRRRCADKFP